MATHKLSDLQIKVCIVPKRVRWPEAHVSPAWTKAHYCVHALEDLVRHVDFNCYQAEENKTLSAAAVRRRRAEICDQALRRLVNFAAFDLAQKALSGDIIALERLNDREPEQVRVLQEMKQGVQDLQEGIGATRRMILERCKTREVISA
jgi:hypothetical protein